MFGFIGRFWRKRQRSIDMAVLWPTCKEYAPTLEKARMAFYLHASNDPAWTKDYAAADLIEFVEQLR